MYHENSRLSIFLGGLSGVCTFFAENGYFLESFLQLIKVIFFAVIGGFFGYIGKIVAEIIHEFIKK